MHQSTFLADTVQGYSVAILTFKQRKRSAIFMVPVSSNNCTQYCTLSLTAIISFKKSLDFHSEFYTYLNSSEKCVWRRVRRGGE